MLRLPKPGTFETLVSTVVVPTAGLWRLSKRPAGEPCWARGAQSRFDDPAGATPGAATFGVLCAGHDPETAFCESVTHENSLFVNGAFVISKAGLVVRSLVGFKRPTKASLTLADLTGAGLKTLGLSNDISAGDDDRVSQAWAAATHVARPELDGIRYVSRQRNDAFCCALFDRSGVVGDGVVPMPDPVLNALCLRFNVRVVAKSLCLFPNLPPGLPMPVTHLPRSAWHDVSVPSRLAARPRDTRCLPVPWGAPIDKSGPLTHAQRRYGATSQFRHCRATRA